MTTGHVEPQSLRNDSPLLHLNQLSVAYAGGAIKALTNVNLEVGAHEIVALLGVNGAGKSTTMRAISGLLTMNGGGVTNGTITFDGEDLSGIESWKIVRRGIANVLEGRRIFSDLTVEENLKVGGFTVRDRVRFRDGYDRAMTMFPVLAERRKQLGGLLSGGEQQMLAIGRALIQSPRLLLLDEPSLGLAPLVVQQIKNIIVEINQQGTAVVLIEQNASMSLSIADYGYVLEQHTVGRHGAAADLLEDTTIRDVYLGIGDEGARSYSHRTPVTTTRTAGSA
jgi:ABC-type branched-subunit amino acid transport system ATPase component